MPRARFIAPLTSHACIALLVMAACLCTGLGGCAGKYVTPGGPADFRALGISRQEADAITDTSIAERMSRRPAASFPASIALVRVQAGGYYSHSSRGIGSGRYTILTNRDVEQPEQLSRLETLPMTRGLASLSRLITPQQVNTDMDLRSAAADLQADMILLYTFDTVFTTETTIPALGVITLGLFPNEQARVVSTASAALVDTRTGFVYGVAESTSKTTQLANAWTSDDAVDQSRRRAETEAFGGLVTNLEALWTTVVNRYGPPSGAAPAGTATSLAPGSAQASDAPASSPSGQ